ncbi:MAG: hypothetical protein WC644_01820 [Ignavibacteria bacterium]
MTKISEELKYRNDVRKKVSDKVSKDISTRISSQIVFNKMENSLLNSKINGKKFSKKKARDIVFHMRDWIFEFMELVSYYKNPGNFSEDEISVILMNFLIHAPAHIAAAKKLYTGEALSDVFGIDAVNAFPKSTNKRMKL